MDISINDFIYRGKITKLGDGDTFRTFLDMGRNQWEKNVGIRVAYINSPETSLRKRNVTEQEKVAGKLVALYAKTILEVGMEVVLISKKWQTQDNWNRLIAEVHIKTSKINGTQQYLDYGKLILDKKFAIEYGTKEIWTPTKLSKIIKTLFNYSFNAIFREDLLKIRNYAKKKGVII